MVDDDDMNCSLSVFNFGYDEINMYYLTKKKKLTCIKNKSGFYIWIDYPLYIL